MIIANKTFNIAPCFTMSITFISPVAKTIELGAVATGKQNAQEQLITTGIINNSMGKPKAIAADAITGISNVAVAVLDVISVKKETDIHNANNISNKGNVPRLTKN